MENITIGQIENAIGIITVIGAFIFGIYKWYKKIIGDRFVKIENRLTFVEEKREEYEQEVEKSKEERMILLRGELAALKGLKKMGCNDAVTHSISEIEDYMLLTTHGLKKDT